MAEKVRDYPRLAKEILASVGGPGNVSRASRCATRLRLVLKDTPEGAKEKVSQLPGVITVVENSGQFQVVIGPHVGEVHEEFVRVAEIDETGQDEHKQSVANRIIATMSAVFAPFVYILAAAGLLQGALIVATMIAPSFEQTGTYEVFSFMSWTPFTFLPIFIAVTASKHFRTNTFIAVLCCAAIMNPTWNAIAERIGGGEAVTFFGIPLSQTVYTSTVLPPLFLVWVLSYLERFLNKRLGGVAQQLLVPLVCLLVMVPMTLLLIGPVTAAIANGLAIGFNALVESVPILAALLVGGLFQVAVIFGVHWGSLPMVLANHDQYGMDAWQAYQTAAVIGQVGAVVGVFLKTRNRELRGVAGSAAIPGLFGITEPTIYGVTLRLKKPFIYGSIAAAVGAAVMTLFDTHYYAFAGLPGPLTIVNAQEPGTNSLLGAAIGSAIAFFGALAVVYFLGFEDPKEENLTRTAETEAANADETLTDADGTGAEAGAFAAASQAGIVVASPLSGRIVPLADVPDEVFASGAMGGGVAVEPSGTKVYAPFDGTVVAVLPSRHAIGLRSEQGVELLVHVGLDTVELDGRGFTVHVANKTKVRAGDLLMEFDPDVIREAGYSLITPLIVTNSKKYADIAAEESGSVRHGDAVITAVPRAAQAGVAG